MAEWIAGLASLSFFLFIGAIGLILVLLSFLFSGALEQFEIGEDLDADFDEQAPGILNLRVISIFLTGLGGLGTLARLQGVGPAGSILIGLAGGVFLGTVVFLYARFLFQQQSSSLIASADLIGQRAEVTVGIPSGGPGQVRCLIGETLIEKIAREPDGKAIPAGTQVWIESVAEGIVFVRSIDALPRGRSLFPANDELHFEEKLESNPGKG